MLCLDRREASLFEGNRDALDEVDVGDMPTTITAALGEHLTEPHEAVGVYGKRAGRGDLAHGGTASFPGLGSRKDEAEKDMERFFRFIDREVLDRFSRPSGLPLILTALPEYHTRFRRISRNPFLLSSGVEKHPGSLSPEELRVEVWRVVEPHYLARLARLIEEYRTAAAAGMAASDLSDVDADLESPESAEAAIEIVLGAIVQRLVPGEAKDLISQLPSLLQPKLRVLASGPDKTITRQAIEAELSERLGIDQARSRQICAAVGTIVAQTVSPGQIDDVRGHLPEDLRDIFSDSKIAECACV